MRSEVYIRILLGEAIRQLGGELIVTDVVLATRKPPTLSSYHDSMKAATRVWIEGDEEEKVSKAIATGEAF